MEFLRRYWSQVNEQLSNLTPSQKWVIGFGMIILLLVFFIAVTWVGQPQMVPISSFAASNEVEVVAVLQSADIEVERKEGQLMVPRDSHTAALALLHRHDLMRTNTSAAWTQFLSTMDIWSSHGQNQIKYQGYLEQYLQAMIELAPGVRSAMVKISYPREHGFGATHIRPTAAVSIQMESDRQLGKEYGRSVAGLISGAVAEMTPLDVVIIDANRGRQFTVKSEADMLPGETLELVHQLEEYHRGKIADLLGRQIPQVIVAVNVLTSDIAERQVQVIDYPELDLLQRESSVERQSSDVRDSGEAGARPNTALAIEGGGRSGRSESVIETESEYAPKPIARQENTRLVGQTTTQINATIAVPRSYFVSLYKQVHPDRTEDPDDEALQAIIPKQLGEIQLQVEHLLEAEKQSVVRAHMYYDTAAATMATSMEPSSAVSGGALSSRWIKPVGLGSLALLSLALMVGMAHKSTQQLPQPTAAELAGVPSTLPVDGELVGEAEESDLSMAGIELSEDEVRTRRIVTQIGEMVQSNPVESASLLRRWVNTEE